MTGPASILFVCMGNICRSPLAEGIARRAWAGGRHGVDLILDSAGTHAYHVGEPPDRRAIAVAGQRGIDIAGLRARQIKVADFSRFDAVLCADRRNLLEVERMRPAEARAEVALLLPWCGIEHQEVPDPYYGDQRDFVAVFELLDRALSAAADRL